MKVLYIIQSPSVLRCQSKLSVTVKVTHRHRYSHTYSHRYSHGYSHRYPQCHCHCHCLSSFQSTWSPEIHNTHFSLQKCSCCLHAGIADQLCFTITKFINMEVTAHATTTETIPRHPVLILIFTSDFAATVALRILNCATEIKFCFRPWDQ